MVFVRGVKYAINSDSGGRVSRRLPPVSVVLCFWYRYKVVISSGISTFSSISWMEMALSGCDVRHTLLLRDRK